MLTANDLHQYQLNAVDFIAKRKSCALWLDMGLGKTAITLAALSYLHANFEMNRTLIIAPLRVILNTWPAEFEKWDFARSLSWCILRSGRSVSRSWLADNDKSTVHLINRDLVPWIVSHFKSAGSWPYDTIVLDESSSVKNPRSKGFLALKARMHRYDRMIQLTGTPCANTVTDLWSQAYLLDEGKAIGKTHAAFTAKYCTRDWRGKIKPRPEAWKTLSKDLSHICMRMSSEDYGNLPDIIYNDLWVELPPETMTQYIKLERSFALEMAGKIERFQVQALLNKLVQFASGAVYLQDGDYEEVHKAKIDALQEIVDSLQGAPLLVASNYIHLNQMILDRFPSAKLLDKKPSTISDWNDGKISMLVAHPKSGGHGLNLQDGGNTVAWVGLNWSQELYAQFNARLHRQGQSKPVTVHRILARRTADDLVKRALDGKRITQSELLESMKQQLIDRQ